MAHIIDLKNRQQVELKPENGQDSFRQNSIIPANAFAPNSKFQIPNSRIISWSGQLHQPSNIKVAVVAAITLFAIATLVQVFQSNIITTIFFALLGTVVLLNANKKTGGGEFEINPTGVKVDNHLHRYGGLKSFWIEYDPALGIKELSLQTEKWYLPYVKIPIDDQNPVQLRLALLEFLPEVEHKDTLVEILARKLGI